MSNLITSTKGPKIQDIVITPIAVVDPPLRNAVGLHAPYALRTIIEVITDDNISGFSEIPGNVDINAALIESAKLLIGADPYQLNGISKLLTEHFSGEIDDRGNNPWDGRKLVHVFSAIEVACLDIQGKIAGRPVVDILGGRCRDRVEFAAYLFYKYRGAGGELGFEVEEGLTGWEAARQEEAMNPEQLVVQAKSMCETFGFKSIKLKAGVLEPEIETASMHALYEAFGDDYPLRIDPNGVWTVETSIKYGLQMKDILQYYEDPTRTQEGMSEVGKKTGLLMATNMCTTSFADIPNSVKVQSEQIILSDHHFWGGLRASVELGRVCDTFGKDLSMHSNSHIGISLMAMVHMAAAIPSITYELDTHYPWQSDEVLMGGRIKFEDGCVEVPSEPGLGIEINRKELQRLHENYLNCGIPKRDDEGEMKKVDPSWEYKDYRW